LYMRRFVMIGADVMPPRADECHQRSPRSSHNARPFGGGPWLRDAEGREGAGLIHRHASRAQACPKPMTPCTSFGRSRPFFLKSRGDRAIGDRGRRFPRGPFEGSPCNSRKRAALPDVMDPLFSCRTTSNSGRPLRLGGPGLFKSQIFEGDAG